MVMLERGGIWGVDFVGKVLVVVVVVVLGGKVCVLRVVGSGSGQGEADVTVVWRVFGRGMLAVGGFVGDLEPPGRLDFLVGEGLLLGARVGMFCLLACLVFCQY